MAIKILDASLVHENDNNSFEEAFGDVIDICNDICNLRVDVRSKISDTIKDVGIEKFLFAHKIGYACVNMSIGAGGAGSTGGAGDTGGNGTGTRAVTNKTCRLSNCNDSRLKKLITGNLDGLKKIIEWNIEKDIMLYRISSVVIPYASHDVNKVIWWELYKDKISDIGRIIKSSGMRVSMHPGQYVNINSPNVDVVKSSIRELDYHAKFMDLLGLDMCHKMIIHIGGAYGDKNMSMKRFIDVYSKMADNIKARLIIENDDKVYNVWDVLDVSSKTGIPVVFDVLHHQVNNGWDIGTYGHIGKDKDLKLILEKCFSTWKDCDGIPKIHVSTQKSGVLVGAHADSIDMNLLMQIYCEFINNNFDIMLETKDKDISVLKAMRILKYYVDNNENMIG